MDRVERGRTGSHPDYAATVPHQAFMIFQMMFAIITPALISGAIAERFKFSTYLVFMVLWATLVYDPLAHWVWGVGGWIRNLGALDFAGGLVVHISSGVTALACRPGCRQEKGLWADLMAPHNLTMTIIGAGLLWFGWFGFNGGSAVASGALATSAFVVTHIATGCRSTVVDGDRMDPPRQADGPRCGIRSRGRPGCHHSCVRICRTHVVPHHRARGGVVCYVAVSLKPKFGYDDSLDVVGVHAVGGTTGALLTGFFASKVINSAGADGLFFGNPSQVGIQALSIVVAWAYSFIVSWILLKILDATMGLRVSEEDESDGLDLSQHGEVGYTM